MREDSSGTVDTALRANCHNEHCKLLELFGLYLDLNVLGFLLFALALGQTEAPKKAQHSRILGHYQPIEVPDPSITRIIEQLMGQMLAQATSLPAILNESRVLGLVGVRFTVEAYHRDNLILLVGIQRDQREVVGAIDVSEILGLLVAQLLHGTEEAQVDRLLAATTVEPLQRRSVLGLDEPNGDVFPVG